MRTEYLRTAKKSYMIVKEADFPFEQYELKMIQHNDIPCLLRFQVIVTDGRVEYWYDVTGMQSLEKQFSFDTVGQAQLRMLLQNLVEMKSAMEEYLLDDANIYFSSSFIYYDRFSGKLRFCYVPGMQEKRVSGLQMLFEEILQQLNHSDPVAVKVGYEMYERCVTSDFVVSDCVECLRLCRDGAGENGQAVLCEENNGLSGGGNPGRSDDSMLSVDDNNVAENSANVQPLRKTRRKKVKRAKKKVDYQKILEEEREVLYAAEGMESPGRTEHFAEEDIVKTWELVYKGDGLEPDFPMTDFPFLIGTDSQRVIGVLQSRVVSRVHAGFSLKGEKLFLEDYNSTNGTYLNRKLIPMNTPMEVHEGDRIAFATEEYAVSCRRSAGVLAQRQ
ncbi:MAG: FHA domain-containing protein [Clostridiales bacterium]|nr:FHA domain-containing protein [Clostridiales bacterium]